MRTTTGTRLRVIALAAAAALGFGSAACAQNGEDNDPFENTNRAFYKFNDGLDVHIFQPLARGYVKVTPQFFRTSVTNFFDNMGYLNTIANDLLQGKLVRFFQDSGRFVINSTLGIGGLFDPASEMGLKQNSEDLGQTFAVWGAGEGAYLVLPLLGPDTVRDVPDRATSMLLTPTFWINSVVTFPLGALNAINTRANLLEATRVRDQAALDPYIFVREAFRQRRTFLIYDGNPPSTGIDEFLDEEQMEHGTPGVLKVY